MPELAEVEVVRRNLEQWWLGRAAQNVIIDDDAICPESERLRSLLMTPLLAISRRGKYLIAQFEGSTAWLIFHFRMTGKIISTQNPSTAYARLSWQVDERWLVFKDPRRLGHVSWHADGVWREHPTFKPMGPEPDDWCVEDVLQLQESKATLKAKLLDQAVVAGIGNIAISELFWRLQWHPQITCTSLDEVRAQSLIDYTQDYFQWLIADQQSDEIIYLQEGKTTHPFDVYGRQGEPCRRCQTSIERLNVASRSSYYCPSCQNTL